MAFDYIITGAGPEEIRVNAGVHVVQGLKDGRVISNKIVSISRGGEETVEVSVEASSPAVSAVPGADRRRVEDEISLAQARLKQASHRPILNPKNPFAPGSKPITCA